MGRLIRCRSEYDVSGIRHYKMLLNEVMPDEDRKLILQTFDPNATRLFGFTTTARAEYERYYERNNDLQSPLDANEFKLQWNKLWSSCPPEKVDTFVEGYLVSNFSAASTSVRRQLTLFLPDSECANCGEEERCIILYANGCWPYPRITNMFEQMVDYPLIAINTIASDDCAVCRPEKYGPLVNHHWYNLYSKNRRGLCKCAGCRAF